MSRENVEVVRGMFEAWNRGDREGWLAPAHPDVEWSSAILREVEGVETTHTGRAAVRRFWDDWHRLWDLEVEPSELRDLGDSVLLLARVRIRSRSSGAEVERAIGYVFRFEDSLVRRADAYLSPEEALEAAGLSE
ncbi:MAG: nuclear transport factor 2 family protein [Thermoleophilaceae bacterium]